MDRLRKIHVVTIALLVWGILGLLAGERAGAQLVLQTPLRQYGGGALISAAASPDGTLIVSGGGRGGYLWDLATTGIICALDYPKVFTAACFSPDSKLLATGTDDGAVILWDTATRKITKILTGYPGGIDEIKFSPDGSLILANPLNQVVVREVKTGNTILTLTHPADNVSAMDLSKDGTRILTGGTEGAAYLWDARTGEQLLDLTKHTDVVTQARISPDQTKALTVSGDKTAVLWDLENRAVIYTYTYTNSVHDGDFSPDGKTMMTLQNTGKITLYNVDDLTTKAVLFSTDWKSNYAWQALSGSFLNDGHRVISRTLSGDIILWDINTQKPLQAYAKHNAKTRNWIFSPNGSQVLVGMDDYRGVLYNIWTGEPAGSFHSTDPTVGSILSVAYSSDGGRIIAGTLNAAVMWDAGTGSEIKKYMVSADWVSAAVFSPDGTKVVTGDSDGGVIVWNAVTGGRIKTLSGHSDWINSVAYSPDGSTLLTGSSDETAILWNAATGNPIQTIRDHQAAIGAVAFSPDGTRMVTAGADNQVRMWDVKTGALIRTFSGHQQGVEAVAFSPDGQQLLTGGDDTLAILWDVARGTKLRIFDQQTGAISSVAFTPDGEYALTGAYDGTALLWPGVVRTGAREWGGYE